MARRATQRGPLGRDEIISAALELAELNGLDNLSLAKIADAVGVKTMSLYNHVPDKAGVLDAMADQIMAEMATPDLTAVAWDDGLRALSSAFRDAANRYPRSAPLVLTRRLNAPSVLPVVDAALSLLRRSGLPTQETVHVLRTYIAFLIGSMLREIGTSPTASVAPTIVASSAQALIQAGLPSVAEAAQELAFCDHEYEMTFGLDLLLDSVRTRARKVSR